MCTELHLGRDSYILTPYERKSLFEAFGEWTRNGEGISKSLGIVQKGCKGVLHFSDNLKKISEKQVNNLTSVVSWFSSAKRLLVINKITSDTLQKLVTSLINWWYCTEYNINKFREKVVYDLLDLSKDMISFIKLFRLNKIALLILKKIGLILSFFLSLWDVKRDIVEIDFCLRIKENSRSLSSLDKKKVDIYLQEKKKYLLLHISAAVLDVAISVIVFSGFLYGTAVISAFGLWSLGAIYLLVSSIDDIYKKMISFELKKNKIL